MNTSFSDDGIVFTGVLGDDVWTVWPKVAPMLETAVGMSNGRYTLADVRAALERKAMQLWLAIRVDTGDYHGAAVTEIIQYPSRRMLMVAFLGGEDLKGWLDRMFHVFSAYGRHNGCDGIELVGRAGWGRVLKPYGFGDAQTVLEYRL